MGDSRFFQHRCVALALGLLVTGTGCLGQVSTQRSTASSGFAPSSTKTTPSTTDLCARFDASDPSRAYCRDCQSQLLAANCAPGVTAVAGCADTSFRNRFTNLVNQCITQSENAGRVCPTVCSAGKVIDLASCSCIDPASAGSSGASGAAGQSLIDQGQFDAGPPVVRLIWNNANVVTSTSLSNPTTVMRGATFEVRNRGGSHPRDNLYQVLESFCEDPFNASAATGIRAVGNQISGISFGTASGSAVSSQFTVSSKGINYGRRGFYFSPESIADSRIGSTVDGLAATLFATGGMAAIDFPYLGKSLALGKYISSGDVPDSATDRSGDTTSTTGGHPFAVDLFSAASGWAGAAFDLANAPTDVRYRLNLQILALDGWTGTGATGTHELLEFYTVDETDGGTKTVALQSGRVDLAKPATPLGSGYTQDVPWTGWTPPYLGGAVAAHGSYLAYLQQIVREGTDLEGRATCNSSPCASDTILDFGLDRIPAESLRFFLQRKSSATVFPIEQRLGIRNIAVQPSNGYPRCSIKYQFRDANQQSSFYCLVMEARTTCGLNSAGALGCSVLPTLQSSSESGVGFFPVSQSQKCFCKRWDSDGDGDIDSNDTCCIPEDTNGDGVYGAGDSCAAGSS